VVVFFGGWEFDLGSVSARFGRLGQARPRTPEAREKQGRKWRGVRSGAAAKSTITCVESTICPLLHRCQAAPLHLVLLFSKCPTCRGVDPRFLGHFGLVEQLLGRNSEVWQRFWEGWKGCQAAGEAKLSGKAKKCAQSHLFATNCCSFFAQHSHKSRYSQTVGRIWSPEGLDRINRICRILECGGTTPHSKRRINQLFLLRLLIYYSLMDFLGVLLSIPASFIASAIYCVLLEKFISRSLRLSQWFRAGSYIILAGLVIELLLLIIFGAVRSRTYLGPGFYVAHSIFFYFGTPALANLLVLRKRGGVFKLWFLTPILCSAFAFFLVILEYAVSETLYGVKGMGGPFS